MSVSQFSRSVMSDSLWPHEPQHARPPCPSPTPRVHPNTSIKSVMPSSHLILCCPLLLLPPIPPSIRVFSSESTLHEVAKVLEFSIIPSKEIPGLISLQSKGFSKIFSSTTIQKHQFFSAQPSLWLNSYLYMRVVIKNLGVGDGQGGLACCSSWGRKESDMTEWLNWTISFFNRTH